MAVRGDEMSPRSGSKTAAFRRSQQIENGGGEYDEPRCGCRCFAARRVQCEVDTQGGERRSARARSEEHTSELQSLMRISYAVFCLTKKNNTNKKAVTYKQTDSNKNTTEKKKT